MMRLIAALLLAAACFGAGPLDEATQLIVVTSDGWDASEGRLRRYQRLQNGTPWRQTGRTVRVALGRRGMAWGDGLPLKALEGPRKQEGDGRSPAGLFRLGTFFGTEKQEAAAYGFRIPFLELTAATECVDDPKSRQYNRIVERGAGADWSSSEKMREIAVYRWGVVVEHNANPPKPGAGSCIFLHIGRPGDPTAGCTAFDEESLVETMRWLDPDRKPLLLQIPEALYGKLLAADGSPLVLPDRE